MFILVWVLQVLARLAVLWEPRGKNYEWIAFGYPVFLEDGVFYFFKGHQRS